MTEPATEPVICVLAVAPLLEVTLEAPLEGSPQIHVHPGGQGVWVARMVTALGGRAVVCGPFGGEPGIAAAALARAEGMELRATEAPNLSVHLVDYRSGSREEVLVMDSPALDRHAQDDLYGTMLAHSTTADLCVVTGADEDLGLEPGFFGRLTQDLAASGRRVVADLSGAQARAVIETGGVVLKMSHEEVLAAGLADGDSVAALADAGRDLVARGVEAVMISRADEPTLLVTGESQHLLTPPSVQVLQHRGAGDSMTAGMAVGLGRGLGYLEAARLGVAAGALNVTRRGLGTGRGEQIELFVRAVTVTDV